MRAEARAALTALVLGLSAAAPAAVPWRLGGDVVRASSAGDAYPADPSASSAGDPSSVESSASSAGSPSTTTASPSRPLGTSATAPLERYQLVVTWTTKTPTAGLWLFNPEGIDLDTHGMVALTERGNNRVIVLHANQTANRQTDPPRYFGQFGRKPGEFDAPEDIAFSPDSTRLYVVDTGNRRVQVLDRKGAVQAVWSDVGLPRGITSLQDGRVVVSDAEGGILRVFGSDGSPQAIWGQPGPAPGQFDTPLGLSQGDDGLLYVADYGNQRIQWLNASGQLVGQLSLDNSKGPGGAPMDVALGENGQLFVAVDRGVLRFLNRAAYAGLMPPLKEFPPPDQSGNCRFNRGFLPEVQVHEGIRRLAANARAGLVFAYSPSLRWMDRMVYYPSKGQPPLSWPSNCIELGRDPELFHSTDPMRLDYFVSPGDEWCARGCVSALDSVGAPRIYRVGDGELEDQNPNRPVPRVPGIDITGSLTPATVLTGNVLARLVLPPTPMATLDSFSILTPARMIRRTRTNECLEAVPPPGFDDGLCIPDDRWWHRALDGQAVVNTGYEQLHVGSGAAPLFGLILNAPRADFRAFADLTHDSQGNLWILARDGHVQLVDARGRTQGEVELQGLAPRTAEAIDVDDRPDGGGIIVLTGDGWLFRFTKQGVMRAAWRIADQAGPGRYRDVTAEPTGRIFVADGAADRILVFAPSGGEDTTPLPRPEGPPCTFDPEKSASPVRLRLGQTTDVTLRLAGRCPPSQELLDVVLVVDASCQMSGERLAQVKPALRAFVDRMRDGDRVALVRFAEGQGPYGGELLLPFTADKAAATAAINAFSSSCRTVEACLALRMPPISAPHLGTYFYPVGCTAEGRTSDGLRVGREALFGPSGRPAAGKALVLVSPSLHDTQDILYRLGPIPKSPANPAFDAAMWQDWQGKLARAGFVPGPETDRELAMWEAWRLWEAKVRVFTFGVGQDQYFAGHPPDEGLLASLANPASGYQLAVTPTALSRVYTELGRRLADRWLAAPLVITDRIPANMRLLPGSVRPPAEILPDGGRPDGLLRWTFGQVPFGGIPDLVYTLQPLEVGHWPTNIEARAVYTDGVGYAGEQVYPVPFVDVWVPTPTEPPESTPTPFPPTVAPSPTSTVTPRGPTPARSPTPSRTPSRTATPRPLGPPRPIYLPLVQRDLCKPSSRAVDVVLALDTSSSMNGDKLQAAKEAALSFIDVLSLGRDRAAIVQFDAAAGVVQPLSTDRAALAAALASLQTRVGTRIDLGLEAGLTELIRARSSAGAERVLILVTDGRTEAGSEARALVLADTAKRQRITLYAIGLGDDAAPEFLTQLTADPSRVYLSPSVAELAAVYRRLATVIGCR